jgi:hypothetical protein
MKEKLAVKFILVERRGKGGGLKNYDIFLKIIATAFC